MKDSYCIADFAHCLMLIYSFHVAPSKTLPHCSYCFAHVGLGDQCRRQGIVPHEVALQLDSGCHSLRPENDDADWAGLHHAMRSEPVLANALKSIEQTSPD